MEIGALLFYFIPTIIAVFRSHNSTFSIFLLDLLLGWTMIGWIIALVWSFSSNVSRSR